jgi:hypothetical protein
MNPNAIKIHIEGATDAEIQRGLAAALAVFAAGGTTAVEAALAAHLRESLHEGGYYDEQGNFRDPYEGEPLWENEVRLKEMTEREHKIAPLWEQADAAAVEACCAGWPEEKTPYSADLSLIHEEVWGPKGGEAKPVDLSEAAD